MHLHRLKEELDVKDVKSPLHCRTEVYKHLKVMLKTRNTNSYVQLWQYSWRPNQLWNLQHLALIWVLLVVLVHHLVAIWLKKTLELTVAKSQTLSAQIWSALQSVLKDLKPCYPLNFVSLHFVCVTLGEFWAFEVYLMFL